MSDLFDNIPEEMNMSFLFRQSAKKIAHITKRFVDDFSIMLINETVSISNYPKMGRIEMPDTEFNYAVNANANIRYKDRKFKYEAIMEVSAVDIKTKFRIVLLSAKQGEDDENLHHAIARCLIYFENELPTISRKDNIAFMIKHEFEKYKYLR